MPRRHAASIRFWTTLSPLANLMFFLSVFCLFASIGFVTNLGSFFYAAPSAFYSGCIAIAFAYFGTRRKLAWMAALIVLLFIVLPLLSRYFQPLLTFRAAPEVVHGSAVGAMVSIMAGYVLMLVFIGTQGRRYFRLRTEVDLAAQIHRALAPPIQTRCGAFEVAGASVPSGDIGGDLLDVIQTPRGWLVYLADVSGHGVAAGVLMSLVKSATRTVLDAGAAPREVLPTLNRVLTDLMPSESYATCAALAGGGDATLRFAAAGHPPLLHYAAATKQVTQVGVENLPLGLFAHTEFASTEITCASGDILALFTDGLTEIFNSGGEEFGYAGLEAALRAHAAAPLEQCLAAMQAAARAWGPRTDDQTLLLLRYAPGWFTGLNLPPQSGACPARIRQPASNLTSGRPSSPAAPGRRWPCPVLDSLKISPPL